MPKYGLTPQKPDFFFDLALSNALVQGYNQHIFFLRKFIGRRRNSLTYAQAFQPEAVAELPTA